MNNLLGFLLDFEKLLDSFETLYVSKDSSTFVNNQLILYHLRQILQLSLKEQEVYGELTTASFQVRLKLQKIGQNSVLSKKGEYSIHVEQHNSPEA